LFKVLQVYPLVFSAMKSFVRCGLGENSQKSKVLISFFEAIEKYHFINTAICTRVGNEVESLYAGYCVEFYETQDFEETLKNFVSALRNKLAGEEEFVSCFKDISYSSAYIPTIAYIFDRFNNYKLSPSQGKKIYNSDSKLFRKNFNIEHFFPQNNNELPRLPAESIDNIGNLLVIDFRTNSRLGNKAPADKMKIIADSDELASLRYLKDFVQKYSDIAGNWNDEVIEERAAFLAKEAYAKVWRID
jgi:hypothetical protein